MRQWHGAQVPHAHSSSAGFRLLAQFAKAARGRQAGGQGRQRSECRPHISSASPRLASPPSSAFTARRRSSGLARIGATAVCCMCMDVCMDLHAGKKSVCTIPCLHEKCASAAIAIPVFFAHHSPILSLLTQASLTPSGRSHSRLTAHGWLPSLLASISSLLHSAPHSAVRQAVPVHHFAASHSSPHFSS